MMTTRTYPAPIRGIQRSFSLSTRSSVTPSGTGRPMRYGDRVFVRLQNQYHTEILAEFTLTDVNDMSEVYGELRRYTRGRRGLAKLYVRNISRGWSMNQPFMLYADSPFKTQPIAASVTHPVSQTSQKLSTGRREIPESVRLRYSM